MARPLPVIAQTTGGWTYDSTKDEMTDEVRFVVSTNSRPTYGDRGDLMIGMIGWRCSARAGRDVMIVTYRYLGGNNNNQVLVETRFDSARVDTAWWNVSTNKHGAFIPRENIPSFTNRVERSKHLLVRVTDPLDGEATIYSFNLVGFTNAHRRLGPRCAKEEPRTAEVVAAYPRWAIAPPAGAPRNVRGRRYEVRFWVAADGQVTRIEVTPEIENESYRRKFIERMMATQFIPATSDGQPIDFVTTITIIP